MEAANEGIIASDERLAPGGAGFEYANRLQHGLALECARTEPITHSGTNFGMRHILLESRRSIE